MITVASGDIVAMAEKRGECSGVRWVRRWRSR